MLEKSLNQEPNLVNRGYPMKQEYTMIYHGENVKDQFLLMNLKCICLKRHGNQKIITEEMNRYIIGMFL